MSARPRKGRQVVFSREDGTLVPSDPDTITGLRFTIAAQNGGEALLDFTALRPRRLALALGRALRHLAAPGGPLGARSTVMAYAVAIPKFFAYLADAGEPSRASRRFGRGMSMASRGGSKPPASPASISSPCW